MKMLNGDEAAKYLWGPDGKSGTLDSWRWQRRGPRFIKVGRLVRYRESDLDAYLEGRTQESDLEPLAEPDRLTTAYR